MTRCSTATPTLVLLSVAFANLGCPFLNSGGMMGPDLNRFDGAWRAETEDGNSYCITIENNEVTEYSQPCGNDRPVVEPAPGEHSDDLVLWRFSVLFPTQANLIIAFELNVKLEGDGALRGFETTTLMPAGHPPGDPETQPVTLTPN